MTEFKRGLKTGMSDLKDGEALAAADQKVGMGDLGKLFKLGTNSFELCAADDLIDGQLESLREFTVNDGFPFGTIKRAWRLEVTVKAANTAAIGSKVVAEDQAALGDTNGLADPSIKGLVKVAADQDATKSKWSIYEILGDKTQANCKVIIERL